MVLSRRAVMATLVAQVVGAWPGWALPAPGPERIAHLQAVVDTSSLVAVRTHRGTFMKDRARFDSSGVWMPQGDRRPALIVIGNPDSLQESRLIRWSDIESIQAGEGRVGRGVLVGAGVTIAVVGTLGALAAANRVDFSGDGAIAFVYGGLLAVGAGIVGFLATAAHPKLETIHP